MAGGAAVNLMAAANSVTQAVNPNILATVKRSTGYSNVRGVQTPTYTIINNVVIQQQAVSGVGTDGPSLQHLDALGIQGTLRSFWAGINIEAVNRTSPGSQGKGGDLIILPATVLEPATTWLCVQIVEQWSLSGWCHFIGQLQTDAT